MDLSLDDIIQKNKKKVIVKGKKPMVPEKNKNSNFKKTDVRSKIIQKTRSRISDAREKIIEVRKSNIVDARLKILVKKSNLPKNIKTKPKQKRSIRIDTIDLTRPIARAPLHRTIQRSTRNKDYDDDLIEPRKFKFQPGDLKRTFENEMAYSGKSSSGSGSSSMHHSSHSLLDNEDPFDCYVVPTRKPVIPEVSKISRVESYYPPRQMSAHMDNEHYGMQRGILRSSNKEPERYMESDYGYDYDRDRREKERTKRTEYERDIYEKYANEDRYFSPQLSDNMRSRLTDKPRDTKGESMGIFANESHSHYQPHPVRQQRPEPEQEQPALPNGFRIIVSNLHSSVSDGDVRELFEDIGPLLTSKLVRTGVAEVVYKTLRHAEEAVETYHNRQLDGQPMKCLLVKPRAYAKPTAPAIPSSSRYGRSTNSYSRPSDDMEVDVETLHKVLFSR